MPNIRQYNATDQTALRPTDIGAEAFQLEGRHIRAEYTDLGNTLGRTIGQVGGQIGGAIDAHEAQMEISHGAAALAQMNDGLVQGWNTTAKNSDPNDASIAGQYRETVLEPALENWSGQFSTKAGQAWAQNQVMMVRQHMNEKIAADQSYRAGLAATTNLEQTANSLANTARTDPSHLDQSLGLVDATVGALVDNMPNLSADQAAKMKTELAQNYKQKIATAAFRGMAEANPEATLKQLESGQYSEYIDAGDQQTLTSYAKQQIKARDIDARNTEIEQRRQAEDASRDAQRTYIASWAGKDGDLHVPANFAATIARDPRLRSQEVENLLNLGSAWSASQASDTKVVSNPHTFQDFVARANLPPEDPKHLSEMDVLNAQASKQLSTKDAALLTRMTTARLWSTPEQGQINSELNRAAAAIQGPDIGMPNAAVSGKVAQFKADTNRILSDAAHNGQSLGPYLNPSDPAYLFSPERIRSYIPTQQERASGVLDSMKAPAPPNAPGWIQRQIQSLMGGQQQPPAAAPAARKPLADIFGHPAAPPKPLSPEEFETARKAGGAT